MVAVVFRGAVRADVAAVVDLLRDDVLGRTREASDGEVYLAAFDAMQSEGANHLIVGEAAGGIVACYQLTLISGLSLSAARRAQIEGVRVSHALRGQGIGRVLMEDAERRAQQAGAVLMQLTSNTTRSDAHRFYTGLGYEPTHLGLKKRL